MLINNVKLPPMQFIKRINAISLLVLFLVFYSASATAASIDFKNFKLLGKPPKYQVQTRVEFELTSYLQKALLSGVTLDARVQFRLGQHRSWWFNRDNSLLTIHYQLKYHALSQHFLLTRNDTNEHWNFSTLPSALRKLGELRRYNLPVINDSLKNGDFYIFAIADIAPATLRLPLRIQSIFSDRYRLTSEGVLWPLP